ncbi:phage tail tape measure protein [Shouchella clausii]|nr:phage tail tape measure protein [Shouchella clausii]
MNHEILVKVGADITNFSKGLSQAGSQLSQFTRDTQAGFQAVGTAGKWITGAGVALAGGLGMAVKTALDFESQMSRVGALSGATGKDLARLTDTAKHLGNTTAFGASEAADGMAFLAMAGYKTNDIIAAMPGLLNTAAAGQLELGETADITSNILQGFGLQAKDTARVADVLTAAFTNSNVDLQMLGETMKYVGPNASAAGYSLEEMAAAAGILGNAGIQASMAGTSLRSMLERFSGPVPKAKKLMKELGIEVVNADGSMKSLADIVDEVSRATEGMGEAQKLAAVKTLVGSRASASFLALMEAGGDSLRDFTHELENSAGTAEEIAAKQLDNLNGSFVLLQSALEGAAIALSYALVPAIRFVADFLTTLVSMFNGLSENSKALIGILMALAAGFMLVVGPFLIFVSMLPSLISGFAAIGVLGGKFAAVLGITGKALGLILGISSAVILAIIGLSSAFYIVYQESERFRNVVDAIWDGLVTGAKWAGAAIVTGLSAAWDGIKAGAAAVGPGLSALWTAIKNIASSIGTALIPVIDTLKTAFSGLGALLTGDFGKAAEILAQILPESVVSAIIDGAEYVKGALTNLVTAVSNAFLNADFTGIVQYIPAIIGIFLGGLPRLVLAGASFLPHLEQGIKTYLPALLDGLVNLVQSLVDTFVQALPLFLSAGMHVVQQLITGIMTALPGILETAVTLVTTLVQMIVEQLPLLLEIGVSIITTLTEGIYTAIPLILELANTLLTTIVEAITEYLPLILAAGVLLVTQLLEGILTMLPVIIETAIMLINSLVESIITLLPLLIETGISLVMSLVEGLVAALPQIISMAVELVLALVNMIVESLPMIIESGIQIVQALIEGIVSLLPSLILTALELIVTIVGIVIDNLPMILDAGVQILTTLIKGIVSILPSLLATALMLIVEVASTIIDNLPMIINAGVELLLALIQGIIDILPMLIETGIMLIVELIGAIISMLPEILAAGVELIVQLVAGIVSMLPDIISAGFDLVVALAGAIIDCVPQLFSAGADLIRGLWEGIGSVKDWIMGKIGGFMDDIVSGIKGFFGIASPSRLFRDDIGQWLPKGLAVGIEGDLGSVDKAIGAMTALVTRQIDPPHMKPLEVARPNIRGGGGLISVTNAEASRSGDGRTINITVPLEYHGNANEEEAERLADFVSERIARQSTFNDRLMGIRA